MAQLTIGMPVYNDVAFIEQSINSILNQTFKDFVFILADDFSDDGSQRICEKYAKLDSRIVYVRHPENIGISKNMKFLLEKATTPFFMWAADDDIWSEIYVEKLIQGLSESPNAISVFSTYSTIDEMGEVIKDKINYNYQNSNTGERLKKFIANSNDAFGYGIFKTEKIKDVIFPIWRWPNHKCAYNNIYPTLCYYLAKGDYIHVEGDSLFYNRIKPIEKVNHKLPFQNGSFKELLAFIARKINLVFFSMKLICQAQGCLLVLKIMPYILYHWLFKTSIIKIKFFLKNNKEKDIII